MTRSRDIADQQENLGGAVAPFVAGKNKVINGDFSVWQRGTSVSGTLTGNYLADRWWMANGSGPVQQSTDVPDGFAYSIFNNSAGVITIGQAIELPATGKSFFVSGQTVTLSFWAKATSSSSISVFLYYRNAKFDATNQSSFTTTSTPVTATTSWVRYSLVYTVPAVNSTNTIIGLELSSFASGVKITGVQLEAGSVATPFTTASGSIGGELALCQRYYQNDQSAGAGSFYPTGYLMQGTASNRIVCNIFFPVQMRTIPTVTLSSASPYWESIPYSVVGSLTSATADASKLSPSGGVLSITGTFGATPVQSYPGLLGANQIKYSAEL
jgi:hypothetical protein